MSWSTGRRTAIAAAALLALLAAAPSQAKRIDVEPGRGTLQRAIDRAGAGDRLVLEGRETYTRGVVVDKRLTIRGPREGGLPLVDGRCREAFTILALDARVTLRRVQVTGAADDVAGQYGGAEVNFIDGGRGIASDLKVRESCSGTQYGINVFDTGDVTVSGSTFFGYLDAGVYVGGIRDPGASVIVRRNLVRDNNHGILIEDSLAEPEIAVTENEAARNDAGPSSAGVYIRRSDGVLIEENVSANSGFAGFWLDSDSDVNVLRANAASGSGTADLQNDGEGNCGSANLFPTQAGTALAPC